MDVIHPETQPVTEYLEILLRRKWLILIPFTISVVVSVYLCVTLPAIFRSETTILVEPQQVPENYVKSTVTGSVQDRLNIISQQILSRTMLESVINEFNLYPKFRDAHSMEEVVEVMRKNVEIKVVQKSNESSSTTAAFTLAYCGTDPEVVQKVTGKLATMYIEENLRVRETMAHGTREFLEKQLKELEEDLKKREAAIREFKQRYMGELPEQLEANLRALDQLQRQKGSLLDSLRDAENRQVPLEQQLTNFPQYLTGGTDDAELYRQIGAKQQELQSLKTRYTDEYPDVIRLKKEIQELEQRLSMSKDASDKRQASHATMFNPAYTRLKDQVDANRFSMENLREEISRIDFKMRKIQASVENAPKREQELITITRDYETIKRGYDSMMERRIDSGIAENLESRQKSEQFKILDPPGYPEKPTRPNRRYILGIGLLLGLGIGGGSAFLIEYFDRSFRSVEELKSFLNFPLLEVIPILATEKEIKRKRTSTLVVTVLSAGTAFAVVLYVHFFVAKIDSLVMGFIKLLL